MSIKRYFSNADNTITNAFKSNLTLRGTGSNSGQSDILEVFSIYGQAASASLEKSRALLNFPINKIKQDRDSTTIPASGSVKFVLRVFNAEHGQTLPKNYSLAVLPISRSWSEGSGMDMESYSDEMPSNWIFASDTKVPDITDIKFISTTKNDYNGKYFILRDNSNTRYNFWFDHDGSQTAPSLAGTELEVDISAGGLTTVNHFAKQVKTALDAASIKISASISANDTGDESGATVRLTNTGNGGTSGSIVPESILDNSVFTLTKVQRGGHTRWTTEGGDFHEVGYSANKNLPHYSQFLHDGTEDVEINITSLVEEWLVAESTDDPDRENYGVMIKMSGSFEDGSKLRSYYTKKFFARGTEFFFKKPHIEARWDSSIGDDRANFYKSSSLATGPENLNTLYMHNYTRNGLSNIPALSSDQDGGDQTTGTPVIKVRLYDADKKNESGDPITLPVGGGVTSTMGANPPYSFGYLKETGIYSASLAYTGSATRIYDVWSTLGNVQLFTGSVFNVKSFRPMTHNNADEDYVLSIANLKSAYKTKDKPSLRLNIRKKNFQPNIYSVATAKSPNEVLYNLYYRAYRIIDGTEVVSYGSGSIPHTKASYDTSGSYFTVDMSLFEPGYMYALEISTDSFGQNLVNRDEFKFRVD